MEIAKKLTSTIGGIAILIVIVVCVNIIGSKLFGRLDVTEDKIFSLSFGTKKLLDKLDDEVDVKLYFSRSLKELPVMIKTYATRVEEVLQEYVSHSGGKINLEVIDPKPDTDEEEWARKYGINGVRLPKGGQMYFGIVFSYGTKEIPIPYLDPRREEFLEYDLSEALVQIFKKEKTKIGVMSSLPVMGNASPHPGFGGGGDAWVLINDLRRNFEVEKIEVNAKDISSDLKVLIVIHPKGLSDTTLYAIDQYVVHGGRLIVAVDPMSRIDMATSGRQARMMGQMPQASSDLGKLFTAWNIEFQKDQMVGDAKYLTQINAGGVGVAYPFFISLSAEAFAPNSVITGNLKQMLIGEGGAIGLKPDSPYTLEPLLETSTDSGTASASLAGFMMPQDMARELTTDNKKRIIAGLLRGTFKSAYTKAPPAENDKSQKPHKQEADKEGSIVIIADSDFVHDSNAVDKFRFGSQVMVRVRNDNLNFVFNATDYLGGSEDLISIRSRGRISRPFTKVAELQRQAQIRWKNEEEQLTKELQDLQKKLSDLQKERTDGNRFVLTQAQQSEIKKFRVEEAKVRKRRREVRKNLREDIEVLGHQLVAANMLLVPLAVSGFGFGVFVSRSRKMRKGVKNG